ncbi:MAG: TlpA family protein disulfide reductase [Gammaproteobacteria bacterium]
MRVAFAGLVCVFLSICVLFGSWGPVFWQIGAPLWAELAIAAAVGLAAGALAPRETPAWLAWAVLVALAWAGYAYGAVAMIPPPLVPRFLVYPLAASVGVVAGLVAWRIPLRQSVWRPVPLVLGTAAIVGVFFLHGSIMAWTGPKPWPAPAFTLQLLNGKSLNSRALKGKTVVLAFWATWCGPCRRELPELQKFYTKNYASHDNVRFFLVDEGYGAETPAKARAFLAHLNLHMPAAFDAEGELGQKLRTGSVIPVRVVIGPRGLVRLIDRGYLKGEAGFPALRKVIRETTGEAAG